MPALHLGYSPDGNAGERLAAFYRTRAAGGAGLLIVGGCGIDSLGYSASMLRIDNDEAVPGFSQLVHSIHEAGGVAALQLFHSGRYAKSKVTGSTPVAPSAVYSSYSKEIPRELLPDEIYTIQDAYAAAAERAKRCGFDAIEIICSAGYLVSQFLSPLTNKRTDDYGGCWENRRRFGGEVLTKVRAVVGPDFPLIVRIAGNDFMSGGNTSAEAAKFAIYLESLGADAVNVTGGWHETNVPQLTPQLPPGGLAYLAATVKNNVEIPVIASNRINDVFLAEELLRSGVADGICMGRQLVCDPDTPNKARSGDTDLIVKCSGCGQACSDNTFAGKPLGCVQNPYAGREHLPDNVQTGTGKRILVVGGGASGIEFALSARRRGHEVTIYEKADILGGSLNILAKLPGKRELIDFAEVRKRMLMREGVSCRTGVHVTAGLLERAVCDIIVLAVGRPDTPEAIENNGFEGNIASVYSLIRGD